MSFSAEPAPWLLVVTVGIDYIAPARMPRDLQRAGFKVALLAPQSSLAAHTAFVDRVAYFPEATNLLEWIRALAAAIRAVDPLLVLPGDDIALRTMMQLVLDPPAGIDPAMQGQLETAVRRSLGDPVGWLDSIDKTRLFELAQRHGMSVAPGAIATGEDAAIAAAADIGYPVIVRSAYGSGGSAAARCESGGEVRAAVRGFPRADAWCPRGEPRLIVQRWIEGEIVNRASAAWRGREVAGVTRGRLATHPGPLGPASVVEFVGLPAVAEATGELCRLLALHGFVGTQYVIEAPSQRPCLIEINRRMLPATHGGALVGVDLAAALFAAVHGREWAGPRDLAPGPGARLALFPQEWYRDDGSAWLRHLPNDAPWHDPALLAAMVRMPLEAGRSPPPAIVQPLL
ncbi:MAG TPA: hypothetical protein VGP14_09155 [Casimicrobiaceae bacterium]|nr:hypothetical protein [Casimicrobiaceae bacterium]